jgi:hypothetical protein
MLKSSFQKNYSLSSYRLGGGRGSNYPTPETSSSTTRHGSDQDAHRVVAWVKKILRDYGECRLLGCGAVCVYYKPTFRRLLPSNFPARVISFTLKMEATSSSEKSVHNKLTRHHIPEDGIRHRNLWIPQNLHLKRFFLWIPGWIEILSSRGVSWEVWRTFIIHKVAGGGGFPDKLLQVHNETYERAAAPIPDSQSQQMRKAFAHVSSRSP